MERHAFRILTCVIGLLLGCNCGAEQGLLVGMGKAEMQVFFPGVGMYGYGDLKQVVECQSTPLYARSMLIKDPASGELLLFVNCELAFMSKAVKDTVLAQLNKEFASDGFTEANVMITATHTHSAPGGFFLDALFNIPTGGFHYGVFKGVVDGIVSSVRSAESKLQPSTLNYGISQFPDSVDVAYNRALYAFNADLPDTSQFKADSTDWALDRTMHGIKVINDQGKATGFVNWFGVHGTCRTNKNKEISSDNKGYASKFVEDAVPEVVAIFAQEKAGDVSPNYHGSEGCKRRKGIRERRKEQGLQVAKRNGEAQGRKGLELFNSTQQPLAPIIDHELMYVPMNDVVVDKDLAPGSDDARTSEACYGKAFGYGTPIDGKGQKLFLDVAYFFSKKTCKRGTTEKLCAAHGNKKIFLNAHRGHILNKPTDKLGLLVCAFPDLKRQVSNDALDTNPWVQETVPVQLFIIGDLCIIGLPGEITTHAGEQLAATVLDVLKERGVTKTVIASYANAYVGYVTTQKGYQCQTYEGGHTIFGQWELAAFQTEFRHLARTMLDPRRKDHEPQPPIRPKFDAREVGGRVFPGSWTATPCAPCPDKGK